jgi:hypothetical protein
MASSRLRWTSSMSCQVPFFDRPASAINFNFAFFAHEVSCCHIFVFQPEVINLSLLLLQAWLASFSAILVH